TQSYQKSLHRTRTFIAFRGEGTSWNLERFRRKRATHRKEHGTGTTIATWCELTGGDDCRPWHVCAVPMSCGSGVSLVSPLASRIVSRPQHGVSRFSG